MFTHLLKLSFAFSFTVRFRFCAVADEARKESRSTDKPETPVLLFMCYSAQFSLTSLLDQ